MSHGVKITVTVLVALMGCDTSTTSAGAGPPGAAEQACLRDVTLITNTPGVRVIGSDPSRAGTVVVLGVGETGRWRCIGFGDGTTADITSITDEGRL